MSIAVLGQVYDEVRRLAIAGSAVAPGDFRLKKLIPALEQAGAKAPVFAKIAEATTALVESDEKSSSAALLELGTLVNAVLYTQGETGTDGELQEIDSKSFGLSRTQTSARMLKPLLESLTSTGPGRMEIIRDAHERNLFRDLRLIRPALLALDDTYGDIADFVARQVLPIYGSAIVSEIESQFDVKGKSGHVRRLLLMHKMDPTRARPHVLKALEEGSKEMRIAAIGCLGDSVEDLAFLLEQSKSKVKDVRAAAFRGLSRCPSSDAVQTLKKLIDGNDLEIAVDALRASTQPEVIEALEHATERVAKNLLSGKEKDRDKIGKEMNRLIQLMRCLTGRDDPTAEKLAIWMLDQRDKWVTIKSQPSGTDMLEHVARVLASGSAKMQQALADAHAGLPVDCLGTAFLAACRQYEPEQVFSMFSPYIAGKPTKKRASDPATRKQAVIIEHILGRRGYWWHDDDEGTQSLAKRLSPRWLDAAIEADQEELIVRLAAPGNEKSNQALAKIARERLKSGKDVWELNHVLETMIRVGHPDAVDLLIEALRNSAKLPTYYVAWIARLIPALPKEAALPKLEALIPTLPEKVSSIVIDQIVELKAKSLEPAGTQ